VQCSSGCKILGFFSIRLTALALALGNFGRIDAIDADTEGAIREGSLLERLGSATNPSVGWNVTDSHSVAVNDALRVGINCFLFGKVGFRDVVDRLKLYYLYLYLERIHNIGIAMMMMMMIHKSGEKAGESKKSRTGNRHVDERLSNEGLRNSK
jgi:hypothetical protein